MRTLYLICCTMRSGSTLLEYLLKDAGIGSAREYLHGNQPAFTTYREYARRIYNGNRRRDVLGWRVMWGHLWDQQEKLPAVWGDVPIETLLDGVIEALEADTVRYISIRRRDHLRQAVSFLRAQAGNRWYCPSEQSEPEIFIPFNAENVQHVNWLLDEFPAYEQRWDQYFCERGITPLRFIYEDLTASDDCIRDAFWQMAQHIGVDVPSDYTVTIPLKKQAGDDVERWVAQYQRNGHGQ